MSTSSWADHEIGENFAGCATLKDVIDRLEQDFSVKGEVICEIRVNGLMLSMDDEERFALSPVGDIRDLSVTTHQPDLLIIDSIKSALEFIPRVQAASVDVADLLRGSDDPASLNQFVKVLDGCNWLVDTFVHIRGAAEGISRPIRAVDSWFGAEASIGKSVREILAAYERKDLVLVADLLEYEITNSLDLWQSVLDRELKERQTGEPPQNSVG